MGAKDTKAKEYLSDNERFADLFKSVVMKSTGDAYVVLIGVENQSNIHYAMAVKNMLYDAISYSVQMNILVR